MRVSESAMLRQSCTYTDISPVISQSLRLRTGFVGIVWPKAFVSLLSDMTRADPSSRPKISSCRERFTRLNQVRGPISYAGAIAGSELHHPSHLNRQKNRNITALVHGVVISGSTYHYRTTRLDRSDPTVYVLNHRLMGGMRATCHRHNLRRTK